MAWAIEFQPQTARELRRLDRQVAAQLLRVPDEHVQRADDPRAIGEPLRGERLGACRKCRVGDCRLICRVQDQPIFVTVARIVRQCDDCRD